MPPRKITRHHRASAPPTQADRDRLRSIYAERAVPEYGVTPSTDRMLEALAVIMGGDGTGFEVNKLTDWMQAFPLKTDAAEVEDWRSWNAGRIAAIADTVMLRGYSPERVAVEHATTRQTVDAIVGYARDQIRRSI